MTEEKEEPTKVIVSLSRHISLGDYCNAETKLYSLSPVGFPPIGIEYQINALQLLRERLNAWEREERANFLEMQHEKLEQEKAFHEKKVYERDLKDAEIRSDILGFIKANPKCSLDSLVVTFGLSRMKLTDHIEVLIQQGKIERAECREAYDLRTSIPDPDD